MEPGFDRALGKPGVSRDLRHGQVTTETETDDELLVRREAGDRTSDLVADGE
jgi:hypothetical protein